MHFDIILPTIGRDSIHAAIGSVFAQTHTNWTLYIIGDKWPVPLETSWPNNVIPLYAEGSGDDSGAFARNCGILCSHAEWIAYIDDDDEWHPDHLATHVNIRDENSDVTMTRTAGQSFMMKHKHPRTSLLIRKMGAINTTDILTVGMAHSRELFDKTSGWQPQDNHDKTLWNEMLAVGGEAVESEAVTYSFRR